MKLLLVGGPYHGMTQTVPNNIKIDVGNKAGKEENKLDYVISKTGDGTYYGVYMPEFDPYLSMIKKE